MALKGFDQDYYQNNLLDYFVANFSAWQAEPKTVADIEAWLVDQGQTAEEHYMAQGWKYGISPNEYFDADQYEKAYERAAGADAEPITGNPYEHYLANSMAMDLNPSNAFDESDFLTDYLAYEFETNGLEMTVDELRAALVDAADPTSDNYDEGFVGLTALTAYYMNPEAFAAIGVTPSAVTGDEVVTAPFTLTSGVDIASANVFNAPRVWDPEGDDQRNSLDDDDVLTGVGENPTLNITYVEDVDIANQNIAPTLNNIETINVSFDTNNASVLDLQDATGLDNFNITRVDAQVTVDNIINVPSNFSVSNSSQAGDNLRIWFTNDAVIGTEDEVALTFDGVIVNNLFFEETGVNAPFIDEGVETINLALDGDALIDGVFQVADLQTLNITGEGDLRIDGFDSSNTAGNGTFTTLDASETTGDMNLDLSGEVGANLEGTSGVNVDFTYTGGAGNDTVSLDESDLDSADTIDGGEGDNTIIIDADAGDATVISSTATISNIQTLELDIDTLTTDADVALTVNTSLVGGLETIIMQHDDEVVAPLVNDNIATWNLDLLADGVATEILHSDTGANGLADNVINVEKAAGSTGVFDITIRDGVNTDPRFNFTLDVDADNTDGDLITNDGSVASITINDLDTESNSIQLVKVAEHNGTITLTGGEAGDFMNLDTTANSSRLNPTGAAVDLFGTTEPGGGAAERVVAATFDASEYLGDVIVRVSSNYASTVGAQTITMGAGDDTVIFDLIDTDLTTPGLQADSRAGLTISDTVAGGEGDDTLAIDGNGVDINLGASEWTNVSGFENLKLMGNSGAFDYTLTLTNQLIDDNAEDGNLINIINDNDNRNDTENIADTAGTSNESAVTIDARSLSAENSFTYDGEEDASQTGDRFIFSDVNINGKAVIDGGAVNNDVTGASVRNNDVIEVRNAAVVSTGDLANISNVGEVEFTNDQATPIRSTIELNDTIVDQMVDSYESSSSTNVETLLLTAIDNPTVAGATVGLNVEAASLTAKSALGITLAGGQNTIATGSGADRVVLDRNADGNDVLNLGGGNDTLTVLGNANAAPAFVYGAENVEMGSGANVVDMFGSLDITAMNIAATGGTVAYVAHSNITMTEDQYNAMTEMSFEGDENHTLTIISNGDAAITIDLSKINLNGTGGLTINATGLTNGTSQVSVDPDNPNTPIFNGTTPVVAEDDDAVFTVTQGQSVTIPASTLLGNDTAADPSALTIVTVSDVDTTDGTVSFDIAAQTITFTAAAGYTGDASFTYTVSDGNSTASATVTGTVTDNTAPVAADDADAFTADFESATTINVSDLVANDTDADGDAFVSFTIDAASVVGGTATVDDQGTADIMDDVVTFTGETDFDGAASFQYTINDGTSDSNAATVSGTVNEAVNGIDMVAGTTYTAVDGTAEIFVYDIDSSSGRAVQADGEVVIDGFNAAEDMIRFVDVAAAGTITTANFETFDGVGLNQSPFDDYTSIYFDPAGTTPGGIIINGIQDAALDVINYEVA